MTRRLMLSSRTIAMAALCVLGITFTAVALDAIRQIGVAHADTGSVVVPTPVTPTPVIAPVTSGDSVIALVALIVGIVSAVGMGISNALHIIAPRTKTTWDDRALAKLDEALSLLRLLPMPPSQAELAAKAAIQEAFDTKTAITAKLPQSGRIRIGTMVIVAVGALLAMPLLGCNTLSSAPGAAKDAVVDCTKADAAAIGALVSEIGANAVTTALGTGKADWSKLEAAALAQGKVIGGCALAEFVAAISKVAPAQPAATARTFVATTSPATDARAALERFRAQVGGGRWSTEVQ